MEQVLAELSNLGLDETTTVVITADHGDHHETRRFTSNEVGPAYTGTYFDHGATLFNDEIRLGTGQNTSPDNHSFPYTFTCRDS